MKFIFSILLLSGLVVVKSQAQTFNKVYNLFQTNCTSSKCHQGTTPDGNLDLVGIGADSKAQMHSVYLSLVNANPTNSYAKTRGYTRVLPGDPYRSFLFRKIHNGVVNNDIVFDTAEGAIMPMYGGTQLTNEQAELVRQWIIAGASETTESVDTSLIGKFYREGGISATKRKPDAPIKGFQIHLGPFFLAPGTETEVYSKYDPRLTSDIEVIKVDPYFGKPYSHHFILFKYNQGQSYKTSYGIRPDNAHEICEMVSAHQDTIPITLPAGTAFDWKKGTILDMNSHYINTDLKKVVACDVYVNITTQSSGIAKQIMMTELLPNTSIYIPNDGKDYTFKQPVFGNNQPRYYWMLGSHTHRYGTSYNIYTRNQNGTVNKLVYDGKCDEGIPGCTTGTYDYQHPPSRFFNPLMPWNAKDGFIHEATYNNYGSVPVQWGPKSTDEMMVMIEMFTLDTAGLGALTGVKPINKSLTDLAVFPNPSTGNIVFELPETFQDKVVVLSVTDINGKVVHTKSYKSLNKIILERGGLKSGMYFYWLQSGEFISRGKVVFE